MKKITITLYSFDELDEKAKRKALDSLIETNVDYEWWESMYEDSARVGIKITSFDLDKECCGEFIGSAPESAELILKEHGEGTETYKTAQMFLTDRDSLVEKYSDGIKKDCVADGNEDAYDTEADEHEEDFLRAILEDYLVLLKQEYEYLTSDEAVIETINSNDWTFEEDGTMNNRSEV